MKKYISILLAGIVCLSTTSTSLAKSKNDITVNVDGYKMEIVGHPAVLDSNTGRVLIPFKSLFLALGVPQNDIKWDAATKTAIGKKDGTVVELTNGKINAKVDGVEVKMDNAPVIMGASMMVPLSFVAKNMGGQTQWLGAPNYIVNITMSDGLFPVDVPKPTVPVVPQPKPIQNVGAPAKDTGKKNSALWGTFAINNKKDEKIVAQFKSDKTVDIKNITNGKTEVGTYSINGNSVVIKSNIIGGSYTMTSTVYQGITYYILKSADNISSIALGTISYEDFASVY